MMRFRPKRPRSSEPGMWRICEALKEFREAEQELNSIRLADSGDSVCQEATLYRSKPAILVLTPQFLKLLRRDGREVFSLPMTDWYRWAASNPSNHADAVCREDPGRYLLVSTVTDNVVKKNRHYPMAVKDASVWVERIQAIRDRRWFGGANP